MMAEAPEYLSGSQEEEGGEFSGEGPFGEPSIGMPPEIPRFPGVFSAGSPSPIFLQEGAGPRKL